MNKIMYSVNPNSELLQSKPQVNFPSILTIDLATVDSRLSIGNNFIY